jgi:DDE superfamily endonuclease
MVLTHTQGMARPALRIEVKKKDQKELKSLLRGGIQQVRVVLRAIALWQLARGVSAPRISGVVPLTPQAIRKVGHRYQEGALNARYMRSSGPAQPRYWRTARGSALSRWSAATRQRVAPAGPYDWWPRRPSSADWFREWEEKPSESCCSTTTSSRGGKKMWCVAELNEEYIAKMEDVLETYEQPYNPKQPVVCVDEKPVTLHADIRSASPAAPGREARQDNEYERRGTANVFCAVEPKAGRHFTYPTPDRSAVEFAQVAFDLATRYPEAETIHLVMDNLNIHRRKSLTDLLGEEIGGEVWDRFTVHYTPTHGSWLNQAEIEIGIFSPTMPRHQENS